MAFTAVSFILKSRPSPSLRKRVIKQALASPHATVVGEAAKSFYYHHSFWPEKETDAIIAAHLPRLIRKYPHANYPLYYMLKCRPAVITAETTKELLWLINNAPEKHCSRAAAMLIDYRIPLPDKTFDRLLEHGPFLYNLLTRSSLLPRSQHRALQRAFIQYAAGTTYSFRANAIDLARARDPELQPILKRMLNNPKHASFARDILLRYYAYKHTVQDLLEEIGSSSARGKHNFEHAYAAVRKMATDLKNRGNDTAEELREVVLSPESSLSAVTAALAALDAIGARINEKLLGRLYPAAFKYDAGPAKSLLFKYRPLAFAAVLKEKIDSGDSWKWDDHVDMLLVVDLEAGKKRIREALAAPNHERRLMAIQLAGKHGLRALLPKIREIAEHEQAMGVRATALGTLVRMRAEGIEKLLQEALGDPFLGRTAVSGLLDLNRENAKPLLLGTLRGPAKDHKWALEKMLELGYRDAAPHVLLYLRARALGGEALTEWEKLNKAPNLFGRIASGTTIAESGGVMVAVTSEPSYHALAAAIRLLEKFEYKQAAPALVEILKNDKYGLTRLAIEALKKLDLDALGQVLPKVFDPNRNDWEQLLTDLLDFAPEHGAEQLLKLLKRKDSSLSLSQLTNILRRRNGLRCADELLRVLDRQPLDESKRAAFVYALVHGNPPAPVQDVLRLIRSFRQPAIRLTMLRDLDAPAIIAELADELWRYSLDPDRPYAHIALNAYAQLRTDEAYKQLLRRALAPEDRERYAAVESLLKHFPERIVEIVREHHAELWRVSSFRAGISEALKQQRPDITRLLAGLDRQTIRLSEYAGSESIVGRALVTAAELDMGEFMPEMEKLLRSENPLERRLGRKMLFHFDPDRLCATLIGVAEDPPAGITYFEIIDTLLKWGKPEGLRVVLKYQDDWLRGQTLQIIRRLAELGDARAAPLALRYIREQNTDYQKAIAALLRLDPIQFLKPMLEMSGLAEGSQIRAQAKTLNWTDEVMARFEKALRK